MPITLTKITQFSGHKEAIYALVYDKTKNTVLSAGGDGYIVSWDIYGNGEGKTIAKIDSTIYGMVLSSNNYTLYAVTRSGELYCINLVKKTITKRLIISDKPLFSICLKGQYLFLGNESGEVFKLNEDLSLLDKANFGDKSIRQIINHGENIYLATSSNSIYEISQELKICDKMTNAHENSIFGITTGNNKLWSGGRDALLKIWKSNELVAEIKAHNLHINSLDYNLTNKLIISGSMDKSVKIWNSKTHQLLKVLNKDKCDFHISSVNKVLWIGPNEFISCGDDRMVIYTEIDIK